MCAACTEKFYSMLNFGVITTRRLATQTTTEAISHIIYIHAGSHTDSYLNFSSFYFIQLTTSPSRLASFRADTALRQLVNEVMRLTRSLLLLIVAMTTLSFSKSRTSCLHFALLFACYLV